MTYTKEQVEELLREQRQKCWESVQKFTEYLALEYPAIVHHAIITSWTEEEEKWRAQKH